MFKKRRGIKLPYSRQGLIHFTCLTYKEQPQKVRERIDRLCREVGGENYCALFDMLTSDNSVESICRKHHIGSPTTLYNLRKDFYESW